jgi:hypothetical protein
MAQGRVCLAKCTVGHHAFDCMDGELNLTHKLGEWNKQPRRSGKTTPPPGLGRTPVVAAPERRMRQDAFVWLAYAALAGFLLAQAGMMAWLS